MGDRHDPAPGTPDEQIPSLDEVASLDTFLDALLDERRPSPESLTEAETHARLLAAQLRLARGEVEEARPEFLHALEGRVAHAVAQDVRKRRPFVSRGGFLRSAATLAGGVGLGVVGVEGVAAAEDAGRPHTLVMAGNERWYEIAHVGELAEGGTKSFAAGGLLGFLLNDRGHLRAVSAICTHMGCRLKPEPAAMGGGLHCLCHSSRFARSGKVAHGLAPAALPEIAIRIENGWVYALGTRQTVEG